MWFKQLQLFQLSNLHVTPEKLAEKLTPFSFTPCLPSLPSSAGWVCPLEEGDGPLVRSINGCMMICLQIEEKILPGAVIRQALNEKIKTLEANSDRKIRHKEKLSLKDDIMVDLLPRAFTKLNRTYAYLDTRHHLLMLGTTSAKITEQFISLFRKSITEEIHSLDIKKISPTLTHWLKNKSHPSTVGIEKACLLQDPNQENRLIRCQHQDLFASGIQSLIKDGCEVIQLALSWHDRIQFVLASDCSFRSIQYQEEVIAQSKEMEPETKNQQFDADFLIMTDVLAGLVIELLPLLGFKQDSTLLKQAS